MISTCFEWVRAVWILRQLWCSKLFKTTSATALLAAEAFGWVRATTEHLRTFEGLKSVRNVGDLYRFKRRLVLRGCGARAYQVPPLRIQRQGLRVPGAPLRSVDGFQSLHKDRNGHRGLPQSTRCQYAPVLGRLVDEKSVKIPGGASPRLDAILGEQARISCERGQIPAHPHSGPVLPGFDLGPPEYARVPEWEEDPQGYPPSGLFAGKNCPAGEDLAEVSRTPVQPLQVGPDGGSPHVANPANAPRQVDTGLGQPVRTHLPERGDTRRVRVVGVTDQPASWLPLPAPRSDYVDRNGCLQGRVGRPPRRLGGLRALVKQHINWLELQAVWLTLKHFLPQLRGTAVDVISDNSTMVAYIKKESRTQSPSLCLLALGMVQATQHLSCGQPPVRGQERLGHYQRWCVDRGVDPVNAPLTEVAEFL